MGITSNDAALTLVRFVEFGLLTPRDSAGVAWLFSDDFPFRCQLAAAASIHLHVKVDDVARLPHARFRDCGGDQQSAREGYVKYAFASGVNMIFSSIPVAEEDRLEHAHTRPMPFLDHVGVDLRAIDDATRAAFDALPRLAASSGWRHVAQGGQGAAVFCCHTEVQAKHWLYPPRDLAQLMRPLEFAFGPLQTHGASMGCDLRPLDPAHSGPAPTSCCSPATILASQPSLARPRPCA